MECLYFFMLREELGNLHKGGIGCFDKARIKWNLLGHPKQVSAKGWGADLGNAFHQDTPF